MNNEIHENLSVLSLVTLDLILPTEIVMNMERGKNSKVILKLIFQVSYPKSRHFLMIKT